MSTLTASSHQDDENLASRRHSPTALCFPRDALPRGWMASSWSTLARKVGHRGRGSPASCAALLEQSETLQVVL